MNQRRGQSPGGWTEYVSEVKVLTKLLQK